MRSLAMINLLAFCSHAYAKGRVPSRLAARYAKLIPSLRGAWQRVRLDRPLASAVRPDNPPKDRIASGEFRYLVPAPEPWDWPYPPPQELTSNQKAWVPRKLAERALRTMRVPQEDLDNTISSKRRQDQADRESWQNEVEKSQAEQTTASKTLVLIGLSCCVGMYLLREAVRAWKKSLSKSWQTIADPLLAADPRPSKFDPRLEEFFIGDGVGSRQCTLEQGYHSAEAEGSKNRSRQCTYEQGWHSEANAGLKRESSTRMNGYIFEANRKANRKDIVGIDDRQEVDEAMGA